MSYYPYGYHSSTLSPGHVLVPASSDEAEVLVPASDASQDGSESNEVQATESDGNEYTESSYSTPSRATRVWDSTSPPHMLHPWPMSAYANWGPPGNQQTIKGAREDYWNYPPGYEPPTLPSRTTTERDEIDEWRAESNTYFEHAAHTQQYSSSPMPLDSPTQHTQQQSPGYGYGYGYGHHSSPTKFNSKYGSPTQLTGNSDNDDDDNDDVEDPSPILGSPTQINSDYEMTPPSQNTQRTGYPAVHYGPGYGGGYGGFVNRYS